MVAQVAKLQFREQVGMKLIISRVIPESSPENDSAEANFNFVKFLQKEVLSFSEFYVSLTSVAPLLGLHIIVGSLSAQPSYFDII